MNRKEETVMEKLLEQVLQERYHKTIREASSQEIYTALLLITKDKMKHMKRNEGKKKLYYIFYNSLLESFFPTI